MKIIHYYSAAPDEKNSLHTFACAPHFEFFSHRERGCKGHICRTLIVCDGEREKKNARRHSSGRKVAAICQEGGN